MPTNVAEQYLGDLAERSFLKLWTVPNPFKEPGKELTDLLVAFGDDLIIFSDKASLFDGQKPLAWERWYRRTIEGSLKQLNGAVRSIERSSGLYLDSRASEGLPFSLPAAADQRLHLITVARPSHDPHKKPSDWNALTYDTDGGTAPFKIGPAFVGAHFVHIFDSESIEFLLTQLDTAPDFLRYLKSREQALRSTKHLSFAERDLFSTAVKSWTGGKGFEVQLPSPDIDGKIAIPAGLWSDYVASDGATLTKSQYANSRNIDLLVDHFHTEYAANRNFHLPKPAFDSHENAMRMLASESRFSRRLIANELVDLLGEDNNLTFWASSVPSPDHPQVRYVWLTYPEPVRDEPLERYEELILRHLRRHLLVARLTFGAAIFVGIAAPNSGIEMLSYFMCVMDGNVWTAEDEEEAKHWRAQGVFAEPETVHRLYEP